MRKVERENIGGEREEEREDEGTRGRAGGTCRDRSEMTLLFVLTIVHVPQPAPPRLVSLTSSLWCWFSTSPGTREGTGLQLLVKTTPGI